MGDDQKARSEWRAIRALPPGDALAQIRATIATRHLTGLRHPHGFYVVLLHRDIREEWRLHVWPDTTRQYVGMPARVHTHDRHVDSRLLVGTLSNVTYRSQVCGEGGYPLYQVTYLGDKYYEATKNVLRKSSVRLAVEEVERMTMIAGDSYRVDRHTFHEAMVPNGQTTITLVCLHGYEPGSVGVLGIDGYSRDLVFERAIVSNEDLLSALQAF
ncbi:hypothetical protein [Pseudomonas rhodesiae]|uniref:hypothetical protein n=1 Tax=Pseudomonas rhodesiae TaxID=76760 RepID=UPI001F267253|nr:hypothetical protein [Pseudomonas rhodesiae]